MPAWYAGRYVLSESIRGIDVERGAAGELNGIFGFKLVELLESACLISAMVIWPLILTSIRIT
jgi:hypothetical protein